MKSWERGAIGDDSVAADLAGREKRNRERDGMAKGDLAVDCRKKPLAFSS